mmetsp:Transcript_4632/g.11130  ORF Transcript_4632/g.11130 Transcript_4632/m.11130 type:complete len:104 (+) Transcript_4632:8-319(+)
MIDRKPSEVGLFGYLNDLPFPSEGLSPIHRRCDQDVLNYSNSKLQHLIPFQIVRNKSHDEKYYSYRRKRRGIDSSRKRICRFLLCTTQFCNFIQQQCCSIEDI